MKQEKSNNITLLDVARDAGVSRTTASVALRGGPNVSPNTQKKIMKSAQKLGYVYDRGAANLRSKSSTTVGLIITDLENPFYTALLTAINQELNKLKKALILGTTFESLETQDSLISTMLEYRVGGVLLFAAPGSSNEIITRIKNLGISVVLINRNLPEQLCDFIGVDDEKAGKIAVDHLVEKGHRRIAFVGGSSNIPSWHERKKGYEEALYNAGIEIDSSLIIEAPPKRESGHEAIEKILKMKNPPTAIFCYNDTIAIGAMMELKERGLVPGYDMAIVGVDDIPEAKTFTPKLTTVSTLTQVRGAQAVELLNERIEGLDIEPQTIIVEPKIIVRESCSYKEDLTKK